MPAACKAVLAAALIAGGTLLAGCATTAPRSGHAANTARDLSRRIVVVRRSWHIDVGLATADLAPPLASLRQQFPNARYLLFGFGDRHYLVDQDRGWDGMLAALWPGAAIVLVTGLDDNAQDAFGAQRVVSIPVSAEQQDALQRYLGESLSAKDGGVVPVQPGPYEDSAYYATPLHYSALHTCNTWAAQALRAAQLPIHSAGVLFAGQLWIQARRLDAGP
jgi:uncharacterized protein (TIGR02117 family)